MGSTSLLLNTWQALSLPIGLILKVRHAFDLSYGLLCFSLLLCRSHLVDGLLIVLSQVNPLEVRLLQDLSSDHDIEAQLVMRKLDIIQDLTHYYDLLLVHDLSFLRYILEQTMDVEWLLGSYNHWCLCIYIVSMEHGVALRTLPENGKGSAVVGDI